MNDRSLILDSSDETEMILKQHLGVLGPKYIGKISFVFHFIKQIQRERTEGALRLLPTFAGVFRGLRKKIRARHKSLTNCTKRNKWSLQQKYFLSDFSF